MVPMVAAVATDEPEVAANRADDPMFECIKPPGNQPSHLTMPSYMRSVMPARSRISPSNTNNGIATSRKSVPVCQTISPRARWSGMGVSRNCRAKPSQPREAAIGTANAMRAISMRSGLVTIRLSPLPLAHQEFLPR